MGKHMRYEMKHDRTYRNPTPTRGPFERFGRQEEAPAPFTQTLDTELDRLKARLLNHTLGSTLNTNLVAPLRRAANEAAAIAWLEPLPLLVFPTLFEEKAIAARKQVMKQEFVSARSPEFIVEVE